MATEVFTPNVCTSPCNKDALEVIFDESSFFKKLFYDCNPQDDRYETGEQVADYSEIPSSIIMNPNENEWPEGFYNVQNGEFVNYATARNFYNKTPYTPSKRLVHVYGVKDLAGNYYYFSSKPTTRELPHS